MSGQTVTVDEAKKKHCIYARKVAQVKVGSPIGGEQIVFVTCNRVDASFVACLADECMKWSWVNEVNGEGYCGAD